MQHLRQVDDELYIRLNGDQHERSLHLTPSLVELLLKEKRPFA